MSDYKIVASSPLATEVKEETKARPARYPFEQLEVGSSFLVPFDNAPNEGSLRNTVSQASKRLDKKFKMFKHNDANQCYEVARIK